MQLHEAIGLFHNQIGNMDSLWTYYSSAALAVLGFTVGSEKATRSRHEISVIQLGYFIFAIGNAFAIHASQNALIELGKLVIKSGGSEKLADTASVIEVMVFHIAVTVSVMLIIEVTYRYNKASKPDAEKRAAS
jgi:hypothetical protein